MTLPVGTDYDIRIEPIGATHFDWLRKRDYAGWVVLVDDHTRADCLPLIEAELAGTPTVIIEVPAGERFKHLDTCRFIWEEMFRGGVGRRWCCLNLGGGVIGDMGGFAASTYKRGIDFVQLPTTLLSQVDASVGGKLGIDFYDVKNSIGLFKDPIAVWVDTRFLATLPARELRSGYAEVIKHSLIADRQQWDEIREWTDLSAVNWTDIIPHSVRIKRDIVLEDPFEHGKRKALNFGHTIGHAVESYFLNRENRLLHGEGVAVGMITESWLSADRGTLAEEDLARITDYCLRVYGHQPIPRDCFDELIQLMRQDKKNERGEINFTFLARPGEAVVNQTATADQITRSLEYYNALGTS
ncbi:3-dehydroquinate synthase [Neolewinella maritima]|uniref:3-dehydroquinate synthase n=1 Tax=Neolewinella maritima TaxID=1383882 RepID=A0ABN8FA74_9BACT|nr:3-dehydroquinate synthase [Neolewinella maritima]CAH1002154.1 3-dehydroquinate synthase [Neolewinella maritima]